MYAIIRKRNVFHQLANLPTDPTGIKKPGKQNAKGGPNNSEDEEAYVIVVFYCDDFKVPLKFEIALKREQ